MNTLSEPLSATEVHLSDSLYFSADTPWPSGSSLLSELLGLEWPAWQKKGACRGTDPDLFFPERGASTRDAKEVCRGCKVRLECLEWALERGEKQGIWGGLSERERRKIRRGMLRCKRCERIIPPESGRKWCDGCRAAVHAESQQRYRERRTA